MKTALTLALTLALAAVLSALAACGGIDSDERLIYVAPVDVRRGVLIEDYTGQRCVNCPLMIDEIDRLEEESGADVIIAAGIHSGSFAKGTASMGFAPLPLYTAAGDEYYNHYAAGMGQPVGLVDRKVIVSQYTLAEAVRQEMTLTPAADITLGGGYDAAGRLLSLTAQTIGLDSAGTLRGRLQLWLTEDSIDGYQFMPDGSFNEHYTHNHVFRAAVNGVWGDSVSLALGEVSSASYTIALDTAWKEKNCVVIAFVYNDDGVAQAVRKPLSAFIRAEE